ncbi:MAG: hypothetical protein ACYS99_15535 [Planctomycetota bacterium]|jgi:hypothetical protein
MVYVAVFAGLALTVVGILGRLTPRVVTGISLLTVAQALGFLCILWAVWSRRAAVRERTRASEGGPYALAALVVALLLLLVYLVGNVIGEVEAGRIYDRVSGDLEKSDPVASLALARHLQHDQLQEEEYALLRRRIVERIAEHPNSDPRVTSALRDHVRTDSNRDVRAAAVDALGKLMTEVDIVKAVAELPSLGRETRLLFVQALRLRTGLELADDAKAWRDWLEGALPGFAEKGSLALALVVYRTFEDDPSLRTASLAEIRKTEGAPEEDLRALLADEDPALREAAARHLAATGKRQLALVLADALKTETDAEAATTMAGGVLRLDARKGPDLLLDVVKTGRGEAGKKAAARRLGSGGEPTDDPAVLLIQRYRKLPKGPGKRAMLDEIVREASKSEKAREELLRVVRDRTEAAMNRTAALRGVLAADKALLTDEELVGLLEGRPDPGFGQAVRAELRRRTGKDGGRDPEKWREILGAK